jgi:hypothetical protein
MYLTASNIRGLVARSSLRAVYPYLDVTPKSR